MPRSFENRLFRVLVLTALFFAGANLFTETSVRAAESPRMRIGVSLPSARESRWQYDLQAFQEQAALRGVDILVRFAGNDPKQQNIHLKELTHHDVDALIVAPTDVREAAEGVAYAKSRKIPVLSYDRLAEGCELDVYVTFERAAVGELMGDYLLSEAPSGKYILLRGPASDSNAAQFFTGAMRRLGPAIKDGRITPVLEAEVPAWRADAAERLVEKALEIHPDIVAVLAPNDDTAGGVVAALERKGLAGKVPVTGQDATAQALERLNSGTQGMTVFKNTYLLAHKALLLAVQLASREPVTVTETVNNGYSEIPTFSLPVFLVDKSNLQWLLRHPEFQ